MLTATCSIRLNIRKVYVTIIAKWNSLSLTWFPHHRNMTNSSSCLSHGNFGEIYSETKFTHRKKNAFNLWTINGPHVSVKCPDLYIFFRNHGCLHVIPLIFLCKKKVPPTIWFVISLGIRGKLCRTMFFLFSSLTSKPFLTIDCSSCLWTKWYSVFWF